MKYFLVRTLPDGSEAKHSWPMTIYEASQSAGFVLYDNARVSKRDAQMFSQRVAIGWSEDTSREFHHESGYIFALRKADS